MFSDPKVPLSECLLKVAGAMAADRCICPGGFTGCVIATQDGRILAQGYNGPPHGWNDELKECLRDTLDLHGGIGYEVCPCVHAEINALAHAARHGVAVAGGIAYCTRKPCGLCARALLQAGIDRVVFTRPDGFPAESGVAEVVRQRMSEALSAFGEDES